MSDELNQLKNEAAAVDAEYIPAGEASAEEQATAALDYRAEAKGLIDFALALFVPLFPSLGAVYSETARVNLANVSAPLMEKYGWNMGSIFENWGAEINFAMIAVPLAIHTNQAIQADMAERRAAADKKPEPQQGSAMGHPGMSQPEAPAQ